LSSIHNSPSALHKFCVTEKYPWGKYKGEINMSFSSNLLKNKPTRTWGIALLALIVGLVARRYLAVAGSASATSDAGSQAEGPCFLPRLLAIPDAQTHKLLLQTTRVVTHPPPLLSPALHVHFIHSKTLPVAHLPLDVEQVEGRRLRA
jgi:hypothetical protein